MSNLSIPIGTNLNHFNILEKTVPSNSYKVDEHDLELTDRVQDCLPALFQDYINFAKPLTDAPIEFFITPFLANIGALIAKRRSIQVGGMQLYPVIWTVLFAGSSTQRKSTALNLAKKPFKSLEDKWSKKFFDEYNEWKLAKDSGAPLSPEPIRRTLYMSDNFSDVTFWEVLRDNPGCISVASEFSSLWLELCKSRNQMQDLALSIFDSEDSVRRSTKNSGHFELNNPVWNIAGATTLDRFRDVLTRTERNSGFLQRILPVCSVNSDREFKSLTELPPPDPVFMKTLSIVIEELEHLPERKIGLTPEARIKFNEWSHKQHHLSKELESSIPDIGGYLSRLNAYGLKIALIFQTLDDPEAEIEEYIIEASIELCDWLLNHITYMLDRNYIFNRSYANRIKIRSLLERHNGSMSRTDLMNLSHLDKTQLDQAIVNEIEAGFIIEKLIQTGSCPAKEYSLMKRGQ
ncbi:MAG: DUF3987 domain-containing protein [Balneolaceae bacterium]|nr:DUF3987 domain-containing protein [Balneolaceae bacterium]